MNQSIAKAQLAHMRDLLVFARSALVAAESVAARTDNRALKGELQRAKRLLAQVPEAPAVFQWEDVVDTLDLIIEIALSIKDSISK